jgi:membrane associated rhomboid family serine protease
MTKYRTTFRILSACVLIECLCQVFPTLRDFLAFNPGAGWFGWFGLMTHMFAHGGWAHLIGNFMFGLPFMMYLETRVGHKNLFTLYVLTGLAGTLFNTVALGPMGMIGASGAIMGCFGAACMLFGESRWEHLLAMSVLVCMLGQQIIVAQYEMLAGIGFYAHVGGCIAGMLLVSRLYKPKELAHAKHPRKGR